jgi:hypothetical protein
MTSTMRPPRAYRNNDGKGKLLTSLDIGARIFVGIVFIAAAVGKARPSSFQRFAASLAEYGVPQPLRTVTGGSVIATESVVALGVLWARSAGVAFLLAVLMIGVVTGAAALALRKGRQPLCNCFGGRNATPVGRGEFYRNAVIVGVALLGAVVSLAGYRQGVSGAWGVVAGSLGVLSAFAVVAWNDLARLVSA